MANTPMGGCFATPRSEYIHGFRPGDCFMEMVQVTPSSGSVTVTMGTTNSFLTHASWGYAVNTSNGGANAVYAGSSTCQLLGASFAVKGDDEVHDLYIIGGIGGAPIHFSMAQTANVHFPHTVYWELQKLTMGGSGTLKITASSDLDYIKRPLYVLPTQILAAAPATGGAYLSEISSIDFTVGCGTGSEIAFALVGGYIEGSTPTDDTTTDKDLREKKPVYLGNALHHAPGDLVGEIVWKTLNGASPSTVTITASTDCQFIKHIVAVLPQASKSSGRAVSWSGTQGATSAIYSANSATDKVGCLVLGIY